MQFKDLFAEYYTMFRGQGTSIPAYGDPEFTVGVHLCNNAIRKWARADSEEWQESWTSLATLKTTAPAVASTITIPGGSGGMRKKPKKVWLSGGGSFQVIEASEIDDLSNTNGLCYFTGGANAGWVLHLMGDLSSLTGQTVDFPCLANAVTLSITSDPSTTVIQMSDPNFAIQEMLAARFANARNGFGYKVAKKDSGVALQNMKTDNHSGTAGKSLNLFSNTSTNPSGWGVSQNADII